MSTGRNGSTPPSTISVGGTPASLARCAANRPATRPVSVVEARGRADHCRIASGSARSAKREQFAFKRRRAWLAAADHSAGRLDRLHRERSRALRGRRRSVRGLGAGGARSGLRQDESAVDPFYAVVRVIARFWIWFFFERVEVRHPERVPRMGPVLLCINHPNNLIDSLLVGSVLPRKVHYLATAALFRNPLIARLLVALGVIPVYLKADDPDKLDRNTEMFAACDEAFE